jgi:hypothetical protein
MKTVDVSYKRAFFIEGFRVPSKGVFPTPERFLDRLPSDAKIVGQKPSKANIEKAQDEEIRPKGYRLSPKVFGDKGSLDEISFADALKEAVREFVMGEGGSVEAWNKLKESDRKARILAVVERMRQGI